MEFGSDDTIKEFEFTIFIPSTDVICNSVWFNGLTRIAIVIDDFLSGFNNIVYIIIFYIFIIINI